MGPPLQSSGDDHRRGLFLTAIGAVLFTFDVPLIRLAASDKWTLMFARGLLLFIAMTILWLVFHFMIHIFGVARAGPLRAHGRSGFFVPPIALSAFVAACFAFSGAPSTARAA